MTVRVIYSRRHHPGSVALRTAMWSPWSHCGVIDTQRSMVVQAVAGAGVIEVPLAFFKADASRWAVVEYPGDEAMAVAAARNQIGTRYDWSGVAGIGLHRHWNDEQAWFCSELVAYALMAGGYKPFRLDAHRITPLHLWMLDAPILEAA